MKETKKSLAEELENLLVRINEGKDPQDLKKQARCLLDSLSADDLTAAQERLVKRGVSVHRVQQLATAFLLMGITGGKAAGFRERLSEGHVLRKVLAEHELIRCFIAELEDVVLAVSQMEILNENSPELLRLGHIVDHIAAMEEHLERENDVLFPAIHTAGWGSLCGLVEGDHIRIQRSIDSLLSLMTSFDKMPRSLFAARLLSETRIFCLLIKEHLFYEDHVLYPASAAMIDNPEFWDRLKRICNEIGYCGLHL